MSKELMIPDLADTIRDRVRQTIVQAIPDDQVNALIQTEWDNFFKKKQKSYGDPEDSSFEKLIKAEVKQFIETKVMESVKKELESFQQSTWDVHGKAALRETVKTYAPIALEGIAEYIATNTFGKMYQAANNLNRGY